MLFRRGVEMSALSLERIKVLKAVQVAGAAQASGSCAATQFVDTGLDVLQWCRLTLTDEQLALYRLQNSPSAYGAAAALLGLREPSLSTMLLLH